MPQRIVCDLRNLKAAVKRVLYPGREPAPRFAALAAHFVFEPNFARPGEGHDKGGVELRGKNQELRKGVGIRVTLWFNRTFERGARRIPTETAVPRTWFSGSGRPLPGSGSRFE